MDHTVTVEIAAPRDLVWRTLMEIERWPESTASMTSVTYVGTDHLALGARVRIKQPGTPPLIWEVAEFTPQESFTWRATSSGVSTVATHRLLAGPANGTTLQLGLHQTGPLAGLIALLIGNRTRRYMGMEAEGIKRTSEAARQASPA